MQLSLSTFIPASPEAAIPGAAAATGDTAGGPAAADQAAVCFEELLPATSLPPDRPGQGALDGPDVEKTASILAASFWMPMVTLPDEASSEPATAESAGAEVPAEAPAGGRSTLTFFNQDASSRPSVFFAAPCARAYAPVAPAPVASSPATPVMPDEVPESGSTVPPAGGIAPESFSATKSVGSDAATLTAGGESPDRISTGANPGARLSLVSQQMAGDSSAPTRTDGMPAGPSNGQASQPATSLVPQQQGSDSSAPIWPDLSPARTSTGEGSQPGASPVLQQKPVASSAPAWAGALSAGTPGAESPSAGVTPAPQPKATDTSAPIWLGVSPARTFNGESAQPAASLVPQQKLESETLAATWTGVSPAGAPPGDGSLTGVFLVSPQKGSEVYAPTGTTAPDLTAGTNPLAPQGQASLAAETTAASALPEAVSATPVVAIVPGQAPLNGTQAPSRPAADPASPDAQIALTEKFAASARAIYPVAPLPGLPEKKDFLNAGQLSVNTPASSVGIGVAQVSVVMPSTSFNRLKTLPAVEAMTNVSVSVNAPTVLSLVPDAPAPPASLRETMAAVVTAVEALERRSDAVQKSVDLHFDVGAERLALRVELRDGTVHTTFRTESPELRAALAHEWQAAMPSTAGRELRLADPVFSSATTSGGEAASGSLGQGAPHQRGQQTPEPAPFARMSEFSDSPVADFAPATPVAPNSATLLQAFA